MSCDEYGNHPAVEISSSTCLSTWFLPRATREQCKMSRGREPSLPHRSVTTSARQATSFSPRSASAEQSSPSPGCFGAGTGLALRVPDVLRLANAGCPVLGAGDGGHSVRQSGFPDVTVRLNAPLPELRSRTAQDGIITGYSTLQPAACIKDIFNESIRTKQPC